MLPAPVSWFSLNPRHGMIYEGSSLYSLIISFVVTNTEASWFISTKEGRSGEELISIGQYRNIQWTLGCVQSKQDLFSLLVIPGTKYSQVVMAMNLNDEHKEHKKPIFQPNYALWYTICSTKQLWKWIFFCNNSVGILSSFIKVSRNKSVLI